jgi:hypothetical protein
MTASTSEGAVPSAQRPGGLALARQQLQRKVYTLSYPALIAGPVRPGDGRLQRGDLEILFHIDRDKELNPRGGGSIHCRKRAKVGLGPALAVRRSRRLSALGGQPRFKSIRSLEAMVPGSQIFASTRTAGILVVSIMVVALASCRRADPTGPGGNPDDYPVVSHFLRNAEGWTAAGDGVLHYAQTGGNPGSTGHIFIIDLTLGDNFSFNAPSRFLGDVSGAYSRLLTFDLYWSQANLSGHKDGDDVVLRGAGHTLVATLPELPATTWTSYSIPLSVAGGWVHQGTDEPATAAQIQAVLGSLQEFRIRGEFRSGPEQGGLDNVRFGAAP